MIIADGYNAFFNDLDARAYVVGRGPSQITVSAPSAGVPISSSVIISGKVTDMSAGTQQDEQEVRFPAGVPVSSDASMTDWMGYVYQQKPLPIDFTGVDLSINVIDANGSYRNIGTAKTDAYGIYSLKWTPDIEGKFTVFATFAGNNGFFPSTTESAFSIDVAAPTQA